MNNTSLYKVNLSTGKIYLAIYQSDVDIIIACRKYQNF